MNTHVNGARLMVALVASLIIGLLGCSDPPVSSGDQTGSQLALDWTKVVPRARTIEIWDFDSDGSDEILVNRGSGDLDVYTVSGSKLGTISLPYAYPVFECGHYQATGLLIAGYQTWGSSVSVLDQDGVLQWKYESPSGVDGAHWGDLDGDGTDELVVGLNGSYGLHMLSSRGDLLWSDTTIGNVWTQAVVPAFRGNQGIVLATSAAGVVRMYTAEGTLARAFLYIDGYNSSVDAVRTNPDGDIQIITYATDQIVAFDTSGTVQWAAACWNRPESDEFWKGDLDGDAVTDWVFRQGETTLGIRSSSDGDELATYAVGDVFLDCGIASRYGAAGIFASLHGDTLRAFRLAGTDRR